MDLDPERRAFAGELRRPPPLIADPVERAAVRAWMLGVEHLLGAGPAQERMVERVPFDEDGYGVAWVARSIEHIQEQIRAAKTPLEWVSDDCL